MNSLLDFSISLVIVLFILSVITEKFTQLVRGYPLVFNFLLLLIAGFCLVRGVILLGYYITQEEGGYKRTALALILNLLSFYFIIKFPTSNCLKRYFGYSLYPTSITFLLVTIASVYLFKYSAYFIIAELILYFCLVGLHIIPVANYSFGGKIIDTKFFRNINKKRGSLNKEKKHELTALSFLIGIIVAYLFRGDFFKIVQALGQGTAKEAALPPPPSLGWKKFPFEFEDGFFLFERYDFDLKFAFGLLLTGFFLSFGSKFFHDLLDTLYYTKKAKEALNDPRIYNISSANELENFVENYEVELFYNRNRELLLSKDNILGAGIGEVKYKGRVQSGIRIFTLNNQDDLERYFDFETDNNRLLRIPHEVITIDERSEVTSSTIKFNQSIANRDVPDEKGSITFPVQLSEDQVRGKEYLLTCYHVVKHPNHSWNTDTLGNKEVIRNDDNQIIGNIIAGRRSDIAEAALIELNSAISASDFYSDLKIDIKGSRVVTKADKGIKVYMYSRITGKLMSGTLKSFDFADTINFKDSAESNGFVMYKLLEVQGHNNRPIQRKGDSGNLLFDKDNCAIGIVFAKNRHSTLAMRIDFALNLFPDYKLKLKIT